MIFSKTLRTATLVVFVTLVSSLLLNLLVVDAARPKWHQLTPDYSYRQYLIDLNKPTPSTAEEYKMRESEFLKSLRTVLVHNSKKDVMYKKGINHLSDWTDSERKSLRGGRAGEMLPVQDKLKAESKAYLGEHKVTGKQLPPSFDWRNKLPSVLTAVKNQGRCGSCWAHGATEAIESHVAIATGELYVLSQEQLVQCAANPNDCGGTGGCMGSIAPLAYEYIAQNGGMLENWAYPYTSYFGETGTCKSPLPAASVVFLEGYFDVKSNDQNAVIDAVTFAGPLAVNVDASQWSDYESGVYNGCDYSKNISIDHVVQLVGYSHDPELKQDYWIVRNSWSPGWAEYDGYIHLLKTSTPQCGYNVNPGDGVACKNSSGKYPPYQHTCGECGILFSTSYPKPKLRN